MMSFRGKRLIDENLISNIEVANTRYYAPAAKRAGRICPVTFSLVKPATSASFSGRPKRRMARHLLRELLLLRRLFLPALPSQSSREKMTNEKAQ